MGECFALQMASAQGHFEGVQCLLQGGATIVSAFTRNPLLVACRNGASKNTQNLSEPGGFAWVPSTPLYGPQSGMASLATPRHFPIARVPLHIMGTWTRNGTKCHSLCGLLQTPNLLS
ncbi:hypothetical protein M427DRAFT_457529 [Gonapodya prolifera JEL478]|uniref:Ankyrin n=1 Tax=Gonapodya prolifera (strain JEL478) TaxID=1344416 RepID=A0A139A2H9_GONPJ|nr:hypothetical protein M427DRAFT_457529 [Gonapodya prolifera JEL478]|eukprot:KXS10944.1 hypothetical protein M427DRAFT_457529 [Gonapodya prolifera JEL478]